ncbi:hypothetical protein ACFQU1_06730 [Chelatococcus sp. GCM10030263]|uniref:hypothetical protein n=1 Tax=Chelatococcus sp. GCM10030263 TaxID=3273387 RepID=UPI003618207A
MTDAPSRALRLFGTEEPVTPPRLLTAGPLTAELEAGNLRYIRFDGIEMIRAVSFIVRDKNWGTYNPEISNLLISEDDEGFYVSYDAVTRDDTQEFRYSAVITGKPDGTLRFEGKGQAATEFLTNRTGFVVLHPVAGVAGHPARVEDVDGGITDTAFPDIIDPVQPMMNLRAITHSFAPGASVTCRMDGDTYEMEDQRNWTDASYKTYVRPLALPWPYRLAAGETLDQAVTLTVSGAPRAATAGGEAVTVRLGAAAGTAPTLGIALDPDEAEAAVARAEEIGRAKLSHLVCHYDPRRGHDRTHLVQMLQVAKRIGVTPWLEAIIAEVDGFQEKMAALGDVVRALGSPFPVVLVSPAPDLKCTLPGSPWPPCPPADELFRAARAAFPMARLGGGMFSYFTELNRKRPPSDLLDFVSFTTSALVHAGDDRSVTETLEALPYIARSVQSFIDGRPFAVGPSAIGMRDNPYGADVMPNPGNIRQAMNRNDPRQRGLLGAAWNLGYFAHFAYGGASAVTLGGAVGPFGLMHAPMPFPQPWFDGRGGLFPVFHVIAGLTRLAGQPLRQVEISRPHEIQALAVESETGTEIWLANLTGEPQRVALEGATAGEIAVLDAARFTEAAGTPDILERRQPLSGAVELDAYAVARVR